MWLIAEYQPTSLFSLKPAWATSSGGRSLLLPSPFSIKMALLDVDCRSSGVAVAASDWPMIRGLSLALRGPQRIVVNNTFTRILKPRRGEPAEGEGAAGPYGKSIGFREYVYHDGPIGVAVSPAETERSDRLRELLVQVSYLGKRGGFIQLLSAPAAVAELPAGFQRIGPDTDFALDGIVQQMDDAGPAATFDQVNIYSGKPMRAGKDRVLHHTVLPYRLAHSSRGYTLYERID